MTNDNSNLVYSHTFNNSEFGIDPTQLKKVIEASPILVGGTRELEIAPIDPRDVVKFLLAHPILPTGLDIRANKLAGKGYYVKGTKTEAVDYCKKILLNSGGNTFIKRMYKNAYAWGTAFAELVGNKSNDEILKCDVLHPVYFNFLKKKILNIKGKDIWITEIDPKTKLPKAYSQYREDITTDDLVPYKDPIPLDRAAYLSFDQWGDEVEGVSVVTYLKNTINNLVNTENAGAQAAYLSGNPRYAFSTAITTPTELTKFASVVKDINYKDVIILTQGTDVKVLQPGMTNFPEYHKRFLQMIAAKVQIPMPILVMDSTSTNKATLDDQVLFLDEQLRADENIMKQMIEQQIFLIACKVKFGESFNEGDLPEFWFNPFVDTLKELEIVGEKTKLVERLSRSIKTLREAGAIDAADLLTEEIKRLYGNGISERNAEQTRRLQEKNSTVDTGTGHTGTTARQETGFVEKIVV